MRRADNLPHAMESKCTRQRYRREMANARFQFRRVRGAAGDPWFRLGNVDVTTTVFVTGLCVLSFFLYAVSPRITDALTATWADVSHGELWRLVTWPFANVPSIGSAISVGAFWYFGSKIEVVVGRRRFLAFLLLLVLLPGTAVVALGFPAMSISSLSLAMFLAFAVENPDARSFFGIKLWQLAAVLVGINVLLLLGNRQTSELALLFFSLLVMVTGLRAFAMAASLPMFPKFPLLDRVRTTARPKSASTGSARPAKTKSPRGPGKARSGAPSNRSGGEVVVPGPWPSGAISQAEVDRLLEKIAQGGISSLTAEERTNLDLASKNLRDRRN